MNQMSLNVTENPTVKRVLLHADGWTALYLLGPDEHADDDRWAGLCWQGRTPMHLHEMPEGVREELEKKAVAWLVSHRFVRPAQRLLLFEQADHVELVKALHAGRLDVDEEGDPILQLEF